MISDEQLHTICAVVMRHHDEAISLQVLRDTIDAALGHTRMVEALESATSLLQDCLPCVMSHMSMPDSVLELEVRKFLLADHAGEVSP